MGHALEGSGEASVIIEFFGPPGAGKTTFSHSLTARLRDAGYTVEVHLSARPGEEDSTSVRRGDAATTQNLMDPVRRLTRPFLELIAAISTNPLARDSSTDVLVSKLPRVRSFAALRTRQYLIRLSAAWQEARKSESIVIFDQGYVQAILSILLTNERILEEDAIAMLAIAPRSDLSIRVDAPIAVIESRLKHRSQTIGPLGRLFESDLGDAEKQVRAVDWLYGRMKRTGRAVLTVNSTDAEMLRLGIERAESRIVNLRTRAAAE